MSSDSSLNSPFSAANPFYLDQPLHSTSPEWSPTASSIRASSSSHNTTSQAAFIYAAEHVRKLKRPRPKSTHRLHFKHRYLVESAWRKGGRMTARHITPEQGVVTSLHLTKRYIIVALDNAKIHIFNTKGDHQRTLQGHVMGVWAMVPWEDTLISGGCDRDVRVWNMATGYAFKSLHSYPFEPMLIISTARVSTRCGVTHLRFAVSKCRILKRPFLAHEIPLFGYGTFQPDVVPLS